MEEGNESECLDLCLSQASVQYGVSKAVGIQNENNIDKESTSTSSLLPVLNTHRQSWLTLAWSAHVTH